MRGFRPTKSGGSEGLGKKPQWRLDLKSCWTSHREMAVACHAYMGTILSLPTA